VALDEPAALELCDQVANILAARFRRGVQSTASALWTHGDLRDLAWIALAAMDGAEPTIQLLIWRTLDELRLEDVQYRLRKKETGLEDRWGVPTDLLGHNDLTPYTYDVLDPLGDTRLWEILERATRRLTRLQRGVAALRYIEGLRLWEVAEYCGVSESRVSQILNHYANPAIRAYLKEEHR